MDESKKPWASSAVWGAIAVVAVSVGQLFGYDLGEANGWASPMVQLLGAGLALYGRVKAVKRISL